MLFPFTPMHQGPDALIPSLRKSVDAIAHFDPQETFWIGNDCSHGLPVLFRKPAAIVWFELRFSHASNGIARSFNSLVEGNISRLNAAHCVSCAVFLAFVYSANVSAEHDCFTIAPKPFSKFRCVCIDSRRLKMLEDREAKARKLLEEIDGGEGKPTVPLTRDDLLEKVREIYGAV